MFIHRDDEFMLQQMLGSTEPIPDTLAAEYTLRRRLYHATGSTGPLGAIGLVDLLRSVSIEPRAAQISPEQTPISWRNLDRDGSVRVEVRMRGSWVPGVYLGQVANGTLAIKLEDDDEVREIHPRPDVVRLALDQNTEPEFVELAKVAKVVFERKAANAPIPVEDESAAAIQAAEAATDVSVPDEYIEEDEPRVGTTDWTTVPKGRVVWVSDGDDIKDGVYEGSQDGQPLVTLENEKEVRKFSAELVTLAG